MAIAITLLQSVITSANSTAYALTPFIPVANSLLVLIVHAPGTTTGPYAISDNGSTEGWVRRNIHSFNTISSPTNVFMVFTAWQVATPILMAPSFTCLADAATGCLMALFQVTGVNLEDGPLDLNPDSYAPGGNVIAALTCSSSFSGVPVNISDASANPTIYPGCVYNVNQNVPANPNNAYLMALAVPRNTASYAPPSGWAEELDTGISGPASGLWIGSRIGGESAHSFVVTGTSTAWAALYMEFCAPGQYPYVEPRASNIGQSGLFGV